MATMDDLIEEVLAEYEPRPILDEPIPEAEERLPPSATSTTVAIYRPGWSCPPPSKTPGGRVT